MTDQSLEIRIKPDGATKYRVQLIGAGGKVLAEAFDSPAVYTFDGTEPYIRARVQDSNGWTAWTQPVFRRCSSALVAAGIDGSAHEGVRPRALSTSFTQSMKISVPVMASALVTTSGGRNRTTFE